MKEEANEFLGEYMTRNKPLKKWQQRNMSYLHECDDATIIICYPKGQTEFDVQRNLYDELDMLCRELDNGSEVKSEVTVFCDGLQSRLDLMVFKWFSDKIQAMVGIEVKRGGYIARLPQAEHQKIRYGMIERMGKIPIFYCNGVDDIQPLVKKIGDIIA